MKTDPLAATFVMVNPWPGRLPTKKRINPILCTKIRINENHLSGIYGVTVTELRQGLAHSLLYIVYGTNLGGLGSAN